MEDSADDYQICNRCVMDSSASEITFDQNGNCNFCSSYFLKAQDRIFEGTVGEDMLNAVVSSIKKDGSKKKYDCIIGVSGGVDSTYVAYKVKQLGLRPLAVHFDNSWNSELAVSNIEQALDKLDIDLYTYVINWPEFRSLQKSFLLASTPDGEVPTDHAIAAILYKTAAKFNVKYIINGNNFKNEGILPESWAYGHIDWKYIRSVNKIFKGEKLRTFPHFGFLQFAYWTFIKRIKIINILNYLDFDKSKAIDLLKSELDWRPYGGKHHESVYTKFYQAYLLPLKFNIDKRRAHLSNQVVNNEVAREEALEELKKPILKDSEIVELNDFVKKKFKFSDVDFDRILNTAPKTFRDYPNSHFLVMKSRRVLNWMRTKGLFYK